MLLIAILIWTVFWSAYAIILLNNEKFYIKYRKKTSKRERPVLYHTELFVSIFWSASGYTALFFFLESTL
jgi:hypothetical protein